MNTYDMLKILNDNKVEIVLQTRHGDAPFYNLKVMDIYGKDHYLHSHDMDEIMRQLMVVRADLFMPEYEVIGYEVTAELYTAPKCHTMPPPPGM